LVGAYIRHHSRTAERTPWPNLHPLPWWFPRSNEEQAIGPLIAALRAGAVWHEIIVVDDGSEGRHGGEGPRGRRDRGAPSLQQGNGAAVRPASGRRQRTTCSSSTATAASARPTPRDSYRSWRVRFVHRRALDGHAGQPGPLLGIAALNWLAGYLTSRKVPDLTSGFRGASPRSPARVPAPSAERLLTPTTTTLHSSRLATTSASSQSRPTARVGQSKIRLARERRQVPAESCSRSSRCSARFAVFLPISLAAFLVGAGYAAWTIATPVPRHEFFGAAHPCCPLSCSWWAWCPSRSRRSGSKPGVARVKRRVPRAVWAAVSVRRRRPPGLLARLLGGQAAHAPTSGDLLLAATSPTGGGSCTGSLTVPCPGRALRRAPVYPLFLAASLSGQKRSPGRPRPAAPPAEAGVIHGPPPAGACYGVAARHPRRPSRAWRRLSYGSSPGWHARSRAGGGRGGGRVAANPTLRLSGPPLHVRETLFSVLALAAQAC